MTILGRTPVLRLNGEQEIQVLAKRLCDCLTPILLSNGKLTIWLSGDLGAGKTTLTRKILGQLGHTGKVKSPTYTLCETYEIALKGKTFQVNHFDLYRMNHPKEWEEAGFRETFFEPGLCLVEWPEKAEGTLPTPDVMIQLDYVNEHERSFSAEALSPLGLTIINALS